MSGNYFRKRPWEENSLDQQHVSQSATNLDLNNITGINAVNSQRNQYRSPPRLSSCSGSPTQPNFIQQHSEWQSVDNTLPPLNLTTTIPPETLCSEEIPTTPRRTRIWNDQSYSEDSSPLGTSRQHTSFQSVVSSSASPALFTHTQSQNTNSIQRHDDYRSEILPRMWSMASILTTDADIHSPISTMSNSVDSTTWKASSSNSRRLSSAPSSTDASSTAGRNTSTSEGDIRNRKEEEKDSRLRIILEEMMQEKLLRKDAELALLKQECDDLKQQVQNKREIASTTSQIYTSSTLKNNHLLGQVPTLDTEAIDDAHAKVLGDLQHQVSKQSLSLKTLQNEHDNLLAAFSRSQTRSVALQKKCDVASSEMSELLGEKDKMQEHNELLQAQVEDLTKQRETYRKQAVAGGGQYTSIVQMATQLEMASSDSIKKWKLEKDELEEQIIAYQHIVASLTSDHEAAKVEVVALKEEVMRLSDEKHDKVQDNNSNKYIQHGFEKACEVKPSYAEVEQQVVHLNKRVKELESLAEKSRSHSREMEKMAQQMLMHSSGVSERLDDVLHRS